MRIWATLAAWCWLVVAVGAAPTGTLIVRVTGGQAIPGAIVTVAGVSKPTNAVGMASFAVALRQTHTISVATPGYAPWVSSVWVQKSQTVTVALQILIPRAVIIRWATPVAK